MIEAPAEGVTLERLIDVTRELLRSGRPIAEMNARRKELSAIKGGKLALRAGRSITYAISDVHAPVEDDPAVIGSGPTFLREAVSGVNAEFFLAGSRRDAMAGASVEAKRLGYDVRLIGPPTLGEAREAARSFVALTRDRRAPGVSPRMSVISAGETTVRVPPQPAGRGGRNQEFALAAALEIGRPGRLRDARAAGWALASVGTDGIDGPTDAAGALVDSTTLSRADAAGLDPRAALDTHDSYPFFERLRDLVLTGPTGTNVGDLQVFLRRVNHDAEGQ
jgi:hydroxypyruvate reductase